MKSSSKNGGKFGHSVEKGGQKTEMANGGFFKKRDRKKLHRRGLRKTRAERTDVQNLRRSGRENARPHNHRTDG